jgi:FkbM family methyltransferase
MQQYILFGAGQIGRKTLEVLGTDAVYCFADNNALEGVKFGKKVISPNDLSKIAGSYRIVLTVGNKFKEEISEQLGKLGVSYTDCNAIFEQRRKNIIDSGKFHLIVSEGVFADELGKALRSATIFADIGARDGEYTFIAADVMEKRGEIYAFDPDPRILGALSEHVTKSGCENIHIIGAAASDHNGRMLMYCVADSEADGKVVDCFTVDDKISFTRLQKKLENPETKIVSDVFPCIRLDDFFNDLTPDVLKMDIEGAELFALAGAENLISRRRTIFFLEVHDFYINSVDPHGLDKIDALFKKYGYRIELCVGDDGIAHGSGHPQRGGTNVIPVERVQFEHCIIRPATRN